MLLFGKPKNRAFKQRHVLDVKVARRKAVQHRVRVATLAAGLSLGTLFAMYLLWRAGDWALDRFVYENKAFAVQEIDIQTDGVIALDQLRRWSGVRLEQNLFAIDLARVKRDIELVPAVQSVAVERVLPHTLKIRVVEREPVAQADRYFLDGEGFAMQPLEPSQRSVPVLQGERYPLISGINPSELRAGRPVESPRVRAALGFLAAFERSAMAPLVEIARIDLSAPDVLQVTTVQQNAVTFQLHDFEKQLGRWFLVYCKGQEQGRQIGTLDLSVAQHVPLHWSDTAAAPLSGPRLRKASPYKKKHV